MGPLHVRNVSAPYTLIWWDCQTLWFADERFGWVPKHSLPTTNGPLFCSPFYHYRSLNNVFMLCAPHQDTQGMFLMAPLPRQEVKTWSKIRTLAQKWLQSAVQCFDPNPRWGSAKFLWISLNNILLHVLLHVLLLFLWEDRCLHSVMQPQNLFYILLKFNFSPLNCFKLWLKTGNTNLLG